MAENSSFVQPSIPKFDGHYDHWAMLMENFLRSKEYWSLVENGIPTAVGGAESTEAQRKTVEDQKLKDLKVKNYLFQAIDRSILETILKKETSKNIWDSMKQKYQGTARVKRAQLQALRREFEILQMKAGESVNEYFSRTLTIANKMRTHGETMGDVTVIEKILRSMTPKFNYVVCSIEESNDIDALSVDQLQSSLLVHEQRMNVPVIEEQALKVTYENRSRGRGRGRGGFRGRGGGRGMSNFDKSTVECYYCHKLGHFQYECPSKESEVNYAEFQEEMLLMASVESKESDKEEAWFIDSGCSNHMCGKKDVFSDLDENFSETVKLGNNSSMAVKGKGNVRFQLNGISHIITSVFYVPELKNNLLSIGQLQEKGLTIIFQHGKCKIYHKEKGLIMETIMSSNRMFILPVKPQSSVSACFNTITEDSTQLWHCRFGHLGFKGLRILEQKGMVNGLPQLKTPSKICKDCLAGKQQRDPFPKVSTWRASQILQLIHADICGPITPASNSKKRIFGKSISTRFISNASNHKLYHVLASVSRASVVDSTSRYSSTESTLILIRHGESMWNEKNLFTGCCDVPLTRRGVEEAIEAGKRISYIPIDLIFTSGLIRAQMTAMLAMTQHLEKKVPVIIHNESEQATTWSGVYSEKTTKQSIPVITTWQLNERMYGDLQGHNKKETAEKYGKDRVHEWRRSYDISPPNGESLEMCSRRAVAYFKDFIEPQLKSGKHVMVAAHANSLRSIIMYLDGLTSQEITSLELSTGIPLLYIYKEGKFNSRGSPVGPTEAGVYAYTQSLAVYRKQLDDMSH